MISSLESEEGLIEHSKGRFEHAVKFMRLFGEDPRENVKLQADFRKEEEKVTQEENEMLEADFTEEEIREAIFGSNAE
jgi:hypothetical protein